MTIKNRLTLQFVSLTTIIMAVAMITIYLLSENYREEEFYTRISNRALNITKLLINVQEIDEELLYRIESENPIKLPNERVDIYDYRNDLIFSIKKDEHIEVTPSFLDRIRLDGEVKFRSGESECIGMLYASRYDRFVVVAGAEDVYGVRKVANLRIVLIAVFLIAVLITFFAGRLYAFQALHPLNKLIDQVESITPVNLQQRVGDEGSTDEIGLLASSFNLMLSRVQDAFRSQKNFIANASHEMRTPLTAISGQLEVLRLKKRTAAEYEAAVDSVLDDLHSLNRMANRLLLLAQTETGEQESGFSSVRLDEVMWSSVQDLKRLKKNYEVEVRLDENLDSEEFWTINGNEQLLKTVFINVIENGCKYSENQRVTLSVSNQGGSIAFVIEDQGIGISSEDLHHIFEPFYRGKNAFNLPGHGIGLSLVKRIMDLHKANISLSSEVGKGTRVELRFAHV